MWRSNNSAVAAIYTLPIAAEANRPYKVVGTQFVTAFNRRRDLSVSTRCTKTRNGTSITVECVLGVTVYYLCSVLRFRTRFTTLVPHAVGTLGRTLVGNLVGSDVETLVEHQTAAVDTTSDTTQLAFARRETHPAPTSSAAERSEGTRGRQFATAFGSACCRLNHDTTLEESSPVRRHDPNLILANCWAERLVRLISAALTAL